MLMAFMEHSVVAETVRDHAPELWHTRCHLSGTWHLLPPDHAPRAIVCRDLNKWLFEPPSVTALIISGVRRPIISGKVKPRSAQKTLRGLNEKATTELDARRNTELASDSSISGRVWTGYKLVAVACNQSKPGR